MKKVVIFILIGIIVVGAALLLLLPRVLTTTTKPVPSTEVVFSDDEETEVVMPTEVETESEEVVTETEEELSYNEKYGLPYVATPEKRNDKQVLEKLSELAQEYEMIAEIEAKKELYTPKMLENLVNNPEMAHYVLGYLESDGTVTGGYTQEELESEYPLLLQWDERWGYLVYGVNPMGISGCGPTCLAMASLYLTGDAEITPDYVARYSMEHGHYTKGVGTSWALMERFPKEIGLTVRNYKVSEKNIKKALDQGDIVIISVKRGVFTDGGHFVVIYGYDENGFKVNDPKCVYRSGLTYQYEEFGSQIKKMWAIGK